MQHEVTFDQRAHRKLEKLLDGMTPDEQFVHLTLLYRTRLLKHHCCAAAMALEFDWTITETMETINTVAEKEEGKGCSCGAREVFEETAENYDLGQDDFDSGKSVEPSKPARTLH